MYLYVYVPTYTDSKKKKYSKIFQKYFHENYSVVEVFLFDGYVMAEIFSEYIYKIYFGREVCIFEILFRNEKKKHIGGPTKISRSKK